MNEQMRHVLDLMENTLKDEKEHFLRDQQKLALFPKLVEALDIILDKHRRTRTNILFAREVLAKAKKLEKGE